MSAGAADALVRAALDALGSVSGLTGVHERAPLQAAFPFLEVEAGAETDWGHKTGCGRELRLAVTVHDKGERPARLRRLMSAVEERLSSLNPTPGWQLVTMQFLRSRVARDNDRWTGAIDYRARLLRSG